MKIGWIQGTASLLIVAAACAPRKDSAAAPSLPLETCVVGNWTQAREACDLFCQSNPAAECAAADCEEVNVLRVGGDHTFWEGLLVHSPSARTFTRLLAMDPGPWSVTGDNLDLGGSVRPGRCTADRLYWGEGPYLDGWPRTLPEDLRAAIEQAETEGTWVSHAY